MAVLLSRQVFLIFGKTGWIGGLVGQYLKEQGAKYEYANCRLEDRAAVISEIERVGCCSVQHASAARPSDCEVTYKFHQQWVLAVPAGEANPCAELCWPHWQAQRRLV